MIDHASVPLVTTEIVMKVELVSPLNKQPEFPGTVLGFIEGFEILPEVKSTIFVAGLLGAIANKGVVHPGTASTQSFGCATALKLSRRNKKNKNLILLLFATFERIRFHNINAMNTYLDASYFIRIRIKPRSKLFFC